MIKCQEATNLISSFSQIFISISKRHSHILSKFYISLNQNDSFYYELNLSQANLCPTGKRPGYFISNPCFKCWTIFSFKELEKNTSILIFIFPCYLRKSSGSHQHLLAAWSLNQRLIEEQKKQPLLSVSLTDHTINNYCSACSQEKSFKNSK